MNSKEFLDLLHELFPGPWARPFHTLYGHYLVEAGGEAVDVARRVGTTQAKLQELVQSNDPLATALGLRIADVEARQRKRAILTLGQLLVGRAAELAFEDIYRTEMQTHELELRDMRESRTDTDYRLYNGQNRPVYRINIKFHGALFNRAREMVGLEPEDCFALATYKINGALSKQEEEGLPYIFAIVGVRSLTGEQVGREIPGRYVDATSYMYQAPKATGKRDFEDRIIDRLTELKPAVFMKVYKLIREADWYVLSARKADNLVRDLLYTRVFALRIPRFAQQFRGAELDMHFSLSQDLTPLPTFLATLREEGHPKVVTFLERGVF